MTASLPQVRVVFFDLGFTLWNEERAWADWASWLKVPLLDFYAVLGSVIERGEHHHRVFEVFRPGIDLAHERELRRAAGFGDHFRPEKLYPDVMPCLETLRAAGYRLGVAGNRCAESVAALRKLTTPIDFVGSSEAWGVEKPNPDFFRRMIEVSGVTPAEIAYVGDRVDNDVLPAKAAGMLSVFLPRGPWGLIHSRWPQAAEADICIGSLRDLESGLKRRLAR